MDQPERPTSTPKIASSEAREGVELIQAMQAALRPYIQHHADCSMNVNAANPDGDYCTCDVRGAIKQANDAAAALSSQLEAAHQEVATLNIELDRETELRRDSEAHTRSLQAALDLKPYADEYDDLEAKLKAAEAQLEAAQRLNAALLAERDELGRAWEEATNAVKQGADELGAALGQHKE